MKIIVIGGYPGVGKSTIVLGAIRKLEEKGVTFTTASFGKLVHYLEGDNELIILGKYEEGNQFPGTDTFAMNAQPEVMEFLLQARGVEFISKMGKHPRNPTVLFEGDRLFNGKMLDFLRENSFDTVLCVVEADESRVKARRQERSEQDENWVKGRKTKVDRLALAYPVEHVLLNNTKKEQQASVEELIAEIHGTWKRVKPESALKGYWT